MTSVWLYPIEQENNIFTPQNYKHRKVKCSFFFKMFVTTHNANNESNI